jgi:hypothetical protein
MKNYISKLGIAVLLLVPTTNSYATSNPFYQRPINRKIEAPAYNFPLEIFVKTPDVPEELQKDLENLTKTNKVQKR